MGKNVYEKLQNLLDIHPFDCTPEPENIEILKTLFTQEEAEVSLGLGFQPITAKDVSIRTGLDNDYVVNHLEAMTKKGTVFSRVSNGEKGYALFNYLQIWESPFKKGEETDITRKVRSLTIKLNSKPSERPYQPFLRTIPIQESINQNTNALPYDKLYELVDKAKVCGIKYCTCREISQNCEERETCMVFNETCTYYVEHGYARYLTKEESLRKIKEFDEMGYVHLVNNMQDNLPLLCNCCSCCCPHIIYIKKTGHVPENLKSSFIPKNDSDACLGCGICADKRCPTEAIEMVDKKPKINLELCIGCGLCVTGCPNGAMSLVRADTAIAPPRTFTDLGMMILQEKGKVQEFIALHS
jgi:Na+-translocating ferredoxin:NAD+ oxidoreductase subunit B